MSLITCKDCGKQFSTDAKKCPHCGANAPRRTSLLTKMVAGFIGLGVVISFFGNRSSTNSNTPAPAAASPATAASTSLAPPTPKSQRSPGPAVAAMQKRVDDIEKVTWYQDKSTTKYQNVNSAHIYMGDRGEAPWLRMSLQYAGSSWLFIKKATIVIDGTKRGEIGGTWQRDNSSTVWEWLDAPVTAENIQLVRDMANAKKVVIRFDGQQYYKDREIPAAELKAMRNVLAAYKELGGPL